MFMYVFIIVLVRITLRTLHEQVVNFSVVFPEMVKTCILFIKDV